MTMSEEKKIEEKKPAKKAAKKESKLTKMLSRHRGDVILKSGILKYDDLLEVTVEELALLDKIGVRYKKF